MSNQRHFANFLNSYMSYMDNGFAPKQFHLWSGISIIAAAMERKCWLPWDDTFSYFPNLYVMLVSHPGIGKSSALDKAVDLLRDMNAACHGNMHILPSSMTQAKFIDLMSVAQPVTVGTKTVYHSSGFYHASEASNTLTNKYGDFIASLTDFYGCPRQWEDSTKKDGTKCLMNVCVNLLAGCTFDYLSKLITDDNIMGGFASRINYVVFRENITREAKFQSGREVASPERDAFRKELISDLTQIHKLEGPFSADAGFAACYEAWYPVHEAQRNATESEKMKALLVRKETALFKLCMVLAAAEDNERLLRPHHWERALTMIEATEKDIPLMLRESESRQVNTQKGLNQAIMLYFVRHGGEELTVQQQALTASLTLSGFNPERVAATVMSLVKDNVIQCFSHQQKILLKLLVDPNAYL